MSVKTAAAGGSAAAKKESKLGLSAKKEENFGDWYSEVVVKSEFISYYDISGCYILRPDSFDIWSTIQNFFDLEIKKLGVRNAYFPLFIPEESLNREKDHVEGFAPEVAWVTKSGKSELEKPIAIRPTSETVMYPYYAQWIRSHRDLPLRLNQWTNIIRWEFKHPTPFIRSREFLWQEGHTAFATEAEAADEVYTILDLYRRVYEELLALPVVKGFKSETEKFAGAKFTTSVEAFIPSTGRAIQGATSHCLGQNFSKMFNITFESEDKENEFVWQNSWGLTTRTIGVMIMIHGDDKGVVIPPQVASIQVVVIPIVNAKLKEPEKQILFEQADDLYNRLVSAGIKAAKDFRENYTPGWKYNHWELKGIPIRLELGPRDMEKEACVLVRRDTSQKTFDVKWETLSQTVDSLLKEIQKDMFSKAKEKLESSVDVAKTWDQFMEALDKKHLVLAPWCDEVEVEEQVKKKSAVGDQMGAKTLCTPFKDSTFYQPLEEGLQCFVTGKAAVKWTLWGRSY